MSGRAPVRLAPLVALLVFGLGRALRLETLELVAGFALVGWLPGLALLRVLRIPMPDAASALGVAAALSIPIEAALAAPPAMFGVPLGATLAAVVLASAVVVMVAPPPGAAGDGPGAQWALAGIASAAAALVLYMVRNPFVRNWSDAWFHVAVFHEVALRGVPPGFPHMAGMSLPYPWLFHVWLAALAPWLSPDATVLMASLNVFTAVSLPLILYALARPLGMRPAHAVLPGVVFLLGIDPWGGPLILLRSAIGANHGLAALLPQISGTNPVMYAMAFGYHYFDASLWARLGTASAFNFALVCAGGLVWFAAEVWSRPSLARFAGLACAATALFLWHTLTAYQLVLGLIGACMLALAAGVRDPDARRRALRHGALLGLGVALGAAASAPYLRMVTQGAGGGQLMHLRPSRENVVGLMIAGGPIAVLALLGLADPRFRSVARSWWVGLALALLAVFLFFDLPGSAEEKFFYPLILVLSVWAGGALTAVWSRGVLWRGVLLAVAACGVVSAMLAVHAFAHDPRPLGILFDENLPAGVRLFTRDEETAIAWVRDRSPVRAVFLQATRPTSNEPILVFGARRLYLGPAELFYRATFFPTAGRPPVPAATWSELTRRKRVQDAVFSDAPLDDTTWTALASFPDPLYVWSDTRLGHGTLSSTVRADSSRFHAVVRTTQVTVYEVTRRR